MKELTLDLRLRLPKCADSSKVTATQAVAAGNTGLCHVQESNVGTPLAVREGRIFRPVSFLHQLSLLDTGYEGHYSFARAIQNLTSETIFGHFVGFLGRGISPSQGHYLYRTAQHWKTRTHIHASSRIRTHDPSVREGEFLTCIRPRGQWDRHEVKHFFFSPLRPDRLWCPFRHLYNRHRV